MITVHRKEQFDILPGGIKRPIVVIGWVKPGEYYRLACLWWGGLWLRLPNKRRLCLVLWGRP